MPVEEHDVHEKVKIDADKPYGCHSREGFSRGYFAPDRRYKPDGTFYVVQTRIMHSMSEGCRYDMYQEDPRCVGCTTGKDIEYLTRMAAL